MGGMRTPEPRYDNLEVIRCPDLPVILFDDVITKNDGTQDDKTRGARFAILSLG
jgi:hypothetical protein